VRAAEQPCDRDQQRWRLSDASRGGGSAALRTAHKRAG
jgi:hypothetical protein